MKHYLLNHQPQKELQAACAQQGQAPTYNARGKGRTSASPKTLTRILLVLLTMFLLPSAAWGQTVTVTKTIKFNKQVDAVTSDIGNSKMSVSVTEQITGESSTSYNYDGQVIILDDLKQLSQYSCSTDDGAVFTLKNNASGTDNFAIEIPGVYPNVPTQVTLTVAYNNSGTDENKIKVGDYGDGTQKTSPPGTDDDAATYYHYYHPYRSNETSLNETTLTYTGNNTSGLGTNRDVSKSQIISVYLKGGATFTIKEATITYETNNYGLTVAGIPVTGVNKNDILGDGKVSFTPAEGTTPATLTLKGAEINYESGNVIVSTLTTPLKINLIGNSNINSGSHLPFEGATGDNANLVISGENDASLVMDSKATSFSPTSFYTGFNNVSYEGDLYAYLSENNVVIEPATSYGITIAGVEVTSENLNTETFAISGLDNVTFTPATIGADQSSIPATLTLNGARINGPIKSSIDDLRVYLIGSNTMSGISSDNKPFQYTGTETAGSGSLTIETTDADAGELTMNGIHIESGTLMDAITSGYTLSQTFDNSSTISDNWVYFNYYDSSELDNQKIVINKNINYHLSIGGQAVGKSNASTILGETMSFTPANSETSTPATLTLNGAAIEGGIDWSGSDNLTIALSGENRISNDNGPAINSSAVDLNTRPKLTFVKAADATACSLTLTAGTAYSFISNFAGETYVEPGSGLFYLVKESSATVTSTLLGGGSGTEADPFLITTADQLKDFSSYVNNGIITTEFVKLANDIDCSSLSDFTPIGNSDYSFAGSFDGNNKTISSLTINSEETDGYVGLFRLIVEGTVKNLTLTGAQISGGSATGVIAGVCSGAIIEGCTVNSSSVSCSETAQAPKVGGIVGDNYGTITDCVVSASAITASTSDTQMSGPAAYAGGIVGYTTGGTIKNNSVTGATTVFTYYNGRDGLYSGAVIGYINNEGSSAATLSGNSYEATVTTETKKTESLTKQGQQQRGIGNESDEIGKIELAGTKSITIGTLVEDIDEVSDYYLSSYNEETESTTILALPEKNVVIALSSEAGNDETVRYTITNASTNGKIEATIDQVTPTDGTPYTKIAFTMPNADVNIDSEILGLGNAETLGLSDSQPSGTYYNVERSMTLEDGIVGYVITGVSGTSVTMTRVSYIPKGVPVYVKMGTSEETPAEEVPASKLKYATETVTGITTESKLFVLYKDKFVKVTSGTDIPATKCYLDLSGVTAAGTRGFYYIEGGDDGATAIREVRSGEAGSEKTADDGWHDLQGRKLTTKPAKGLYIRNGKKVVVK